MAAGFKPAGTQAAEAAVAVAAVSAVCRSLHDSVLKQNHVAARVTQLLHDSLGSRKVKDGILDQGGHSDLPNPCVRAYCCLCIRVLNIDVLVLMYSSAMATRSICRQSNAPGRFQWRSTSASLFTSQGRPVSDIHQLHCRLFCKVIPRAVFQGSPLSRVPEGKWLKHVCTTPHSVVPL
jgi:hypothetical protein